MTTDHENPDGVRAPRQSPQEKSIADILGPQDTLTAQERGRVAALAGEHVSTCPWSSAQTDRERALAEMWARGYAVGRTELRTARDPGA